MGPFKKIPEEFRSQMYVSKFMPKEIIIYPYVKNDYIHFLSKGVSEAYVPTKDGSTVGIKLYEAGSMFGEVEQFYREQNASVAIRAVSECVIHKLHRNDFLRWLHSDFDAVLCLLAYMSEKLTSNASLLEEIKALTVKEKIIKYVAAKYMDDRLTSISKERIVIEVNAPLRSVNRALALCKAEGLFEMQGKIIHVLNSDELLRQLEDMG